MALQKISCISGQEIACSHRQHTTGDCLPDVFTHVGSTSCDLGERCEEEEESSLMSAVHIVDINMKQVLKAVTGLKRQTNVNSLLLASLQERLFVVCWCLRGEHHCLFSLCLKVVMDLGRRGAEGADLL